MTKFLWMVGVGLGAVVNKRGARGATRPTSVRLNVAFWIWPGHKVPAAQAKSVAARQTPPDAGGTTTQSDLIQPKKLTPNTPNMRQGKSAKKAVKTKKLNQIKPD